MTLLPGTEVEHNFSPEVRSLQLEFHCLCYFALGTLALLAFMDKKPRRLDIFFIIAAYGGLLEILQSTQFVGRACERVDFCMNTLGAAIACLAFPRVKRLLERFGLLRKNAASAAAPCVLIPLIFFGFAPDASARLFVSDSGIHEIIGIKMTRQANEGYCAPAVLASLLNYHGIPATQEELAESAGSTAQKGTDVGRILSTVATNQLKGVAKVTPIFAPDYARGEKLITDYNAIARKAGAKRLWLPGAGGRLVLENSFAGADIAILRQIATSKDKRRFKNSVIENIKADAPLVWGVMLGIVPEPGVLLTSRPAGHLRLITGFDPVRDEIIFIDTWSSASAPSQSKRMATLDALAITMSLHSIRPHKTAN